LRKQPFQPEELGPNEIIRKHDGPLYFGLQRTALDKAIADGAIPRPMALTPGGRARGWLGAAIIEWQQRLVEANGHAVAENKAVNSDATRGRVSGTSDATKLTAKVP
jgi:predicted DNA-binding transcriptional regulator AlpA